MKKRLRFQMPHFPLKVLRGEVDKEDPQDKLFDAFVPPTTTTSSATEDEDNVTSSSGEDFPDIDEVREEGGARYLGSSVESLHEPNTNNAPEYNTTGSVNTEAADVHVVAQVHHVPDSDVTSNDDDNAPLLTNMHGQK